MLQAALAAVGSGDGQRWAASLRFEGLRLLPVALRLARALISAGQDLLLVWPDAGAAALARRDAEDLKEVILDFNQLKRAESDAPDTRLLLAVNPSPADYEEFQALCENHAGVVLMLNGRLEDAAVGIGSVARERRKGFVASWQQAYWLQPLEGGALMRCFPDDWRLYRQDPDGTGNWRCSPNARIPTPQQRFWLVKIPTASSNSCPGSTASLMVCAIEPPLA